eukprot:1672583-Rhodomonas_salina.2
MPCDEPSVELISLDPAGQDRKKYSRLYCPARRPCVISARVSSHLPRTGSPSGHEGGLARRPHVRSASSHTPPAGHSLHVTVVSFGKLVWYRAGWQKQSFG